MNQGYATSERISGDKVRLYATSAAVMVFASFAGAGSVARAAEKEQLVMPFTCSVQQGRLAVRPAQETAHEIVGSRSQQPVTACHRDADVCSTLAVHRFDIMCGSTRVPWMHIAIAAASGLPGRRWIERGRFGLIRPIRSGTATERWLLPAGFAPLGEAGARIEVASIAVPPAAIAAQPVVKDLAAARPPQSPAMTGATDRTVAPAAAPAAVPPPSKITAPPPVSSIVNRPRGAEWGAVIEARDLSESGTEPNEGASQSGHAFAWLGGLAMLGLVGWAARLVDRAWLVSRLASAHSLMQSILAAIEARLVRPGPAPEIPPTADGTSPNDPELANAAWQAASLLDQIEQAVEGLGAATPLRDVLQEELGHIHHRLVATRAAALDGGSAAKAASQYRALIRELERVRRIANSAATSFASPRAGSAPPQTKSEAYALLGVNADVSEGILKKLVDALRMTWHPDHARSEQDRLIREDRIKQINIAWDIISDKRHAA